MFLPALNRLDSAKQVTGEFKGYNQNLRIADNEFSAMKNLSSAHYPIMTPRGKRKLVRTLTKANGLFAHNKLAWVDGTKFYYDGAEVAGLTLEDSKKTMLGMGAYILIFPDKKYYHTSLGTFGALENSVTTSTEISISLVKLDGTAYTNYTSSATAPASPTDGQLWIDTSGIPHALKQYSATNSMWNAVATTYVKISATGIGSGFSFYDGVTISGMDNESLNGSFILYGVGDDYIIITAIIDAVATQQIAATVARTVPDLDYVTECNNRVWGCSSANHEVYACKQGDPKNWHCFMGLSTDSFAVTIGTPGDFTGAVTHLGYVIFFKADVIHKLYGTQPKNYQLTNTMSRGVQKGSERSIVIVNETLFYKANNDVCAYGSALPASISDALTDHFTDAVSGALGSKYYICMTSNDVRKLYVYDTRLNTWHVEDDVSIDCFAQYNGNLYFIAGNKLYSVLDSSAYTDSTAAVESDVEWFADMEVGMDIPEAKYINNLQLRLMVAQGSIVKIALQYDNEDTWVEKYRVNATKKKSFTVHIIPRRCDTLKIRISGKGYAEIYSLTKTIQQGSDA